jgi:hypothetical protein
MSLSCNAVVSCTAAGPRAPSFSGAADVAILPATLLPPYHDLRCRQILESVIRTDYDDMIV